MQNLDVLRKIKYKKGKKVHPVFLEYTGIHKTNKTDMQLFVYDDLQVEEYLDISVNEISKHLGVDKVNWLNIHGLNDIDLMNDLTSYLEIDSYMISDILNIAKRSKIEEYSNTLFFNIKSILPSENSDKIDVEQISFFLKDGILVSFQEKKSDFFTFIRQRIRTHAGIVREKKDDYLLYLLLDSIIENFYITLENEENFVEKLINESKINSSPIILEKVEKHRDNFNFLKKAIIPLRDSLYSIKSTKNDSIFNSIEPENYTFFERLHQKNLELLEQIEYDLSVLESVTNFYFSMQSHKMNEVMKTLTIVSVFFMPLTFIVGVYGMNFDNMPELHWKYGYFIILFVMIMLLIGMVIYFKKRKWY